MLALLSSLTCFFPVVYSKPSRFWSEIHGPYFYRILRLLVFGILEIFSKVDLILLVFFRFYKPDRLFQGSVRLSWPEFYFLGLGLPIPRPGKKLANLSCVGFFWAFLAALVLVLFSGFWAPLFFRFFNGIMHFGLLCDYRRRPLISHYFNGVPFSYFSVSLTETLPHSAYSFSASSVRFGSV